MLTVGKLGSSRGRLEYYDSPAFLLAWLASEENIHLCGQAIFIDGGSEVLPRGDGIW